jgi:nitrogen fixation protein NifU and related proteins
MKNQLAELYDEVILQHNRAPFNFEKRLTAQHIVEAYNPLCGDKFKLFLDIENGTVTRASFHGYGCAISKAATSVLIQRILGKTLDSVPLILEAYFDALDTEGVSLNRQKEDIYADFKAFSAVRHFPERKTCATLSWEAAQTFFQTKI